MRDFDSRTFGPQPNAEFATDCRQQQFAFSNRLCGRLRNYERAWHFRTAALITALGALFGRRMFRWLASRVS
jgi:hypothetical protein